MAVKVDGGAAASSSAPKTLKQNLRGLIPTRTERKKLVPLAAMFFCILFNYTILRDTKVMMSFSRPATWIESAADIWTISRIHWHRPLPRRFAQWR